MNYLRWGGDISSPRLSIELLLYGLLLCPDNSLVSGVILRKNKFQCRKDQWIFRYFVSIQTPGITSEK